MFPIAATISKNDGVDVSPPCRAAWGPATVLSWRGCMGAGRPPAWHAPAASSGAPVCIPSPLAPHPLPLLPFPAACPTDLPAVLCHHAGSLICLHEQLRVPGAGQAMRRHLAPPGDGAPTGGALPCVRTMPLPGMCATAATCCRLTLPCCLQTNLMALAAGGHSSRDFLKFGSPMQIVLVRLGWAVLLPTIFELGIGLGGSACMMHPTRRHTKRCCLTSWLPAPRVPCRRWCPLSPSSCTAAGATSGWSQACPGWWCSLLPKFRSSWGSTAQRRPPSLLAEPALVLHCDAAVPPRLYLNRTYTLHPELCTQTDGATLCCYRCVFFIFTPAPCRLHRPTGAAPCTPFCLNLMSSPLSLHLVDSGF